MTLLLLLRLRKNISTDNSGLCELRIDYLIEDGYLKIDAICMRLLKHP